jgi:hypothetical protein
MANTNMDVLIPEWWAQSFDALDIGEYNLQNFVSRKYEKQIGNIGDTVNVPITPDFGTADDWTPGGTITTSDIAQENVQVVLDQSKRKTFRLNDTDQSLAPYDLIETYGVPAAKTLLKAVNQTIYLELLKTQYMIDATSALDEDDVIDAKTKLDNNEVSTADRRLVGAPDDIGTMLKLTAFQDASASGSTDAIKNGQLGMKFGFEIFQNNIISKYTPSDVTGAVNNVGGYPATTTTMIVDAFADSTTKLRAGDVFTVAGETGTPYHAITSVSPSSGATTTINFTGGLVSSVADDAVITVTPTRSLVAFVPAACALAARAYKPILPGTGARSSVIRWQGIPIRITTWLDGSTLEVKVQYDILYGAKLVREKRVTRILTS